MVDPGIDALWKRVTDAWDEDAVHGAFLSYCQETGQLGEAAARYSGMKGDRERGAVAQKRLDAVALLATTAMLAERTEARKAPPRWLVMITALLCGALLIYMSARMWSFMGR